VLGALRLGGARVRLEHRGLILKTKHRSGVTNKTWRAHHQYCTPSAHPHQTNQPNTHTSAPVAFCIKHKPRRVITCADGVGAPRAQESTRENRFLRINFGSALFSLSFRVLESN